MVFYILLADPANFVPPNFPIIYLSPYGENCPPLECIRLVPNSSLLKGNCLLLVQNAHLLLEMCQIMYKLSTPLLIGICLTSISPPSSPPCKGLRPYFGMLY